MKMSEMDSGGSWHICAETVTGNVETSEDYTSFVIKRSIKHNKLMEIICREMDSDFCVVLSLMSVLNTCINKYCVNFFLQTLFQSSAILYKCKYKIVVLINE